MNFKNFILVFVTLLSFTLKAQKDTLVYKKDKPSSSLFKKLIIPSSLIIGGVAYNNSAFEKQLAKDVRNKVGHNYQLKIDDHAQYLPIIQLYIADAIGIKAKNHWSDQTKYLLISATIQGAIVHTIKRTVNKTRPQGSPHAFPSGHTGTAFTGATVLYHEFKDTNKWLAYSGYSFAILTGTFRIINNKHWFSDVLAGAGISMLVTNMVYHFEPLKNWNPIKKKSNISLVPYFNSTETGIFFTKRF